MAKKKSHQCPTCEDCGFVRIAGAHFRSVLILQRYNQPLCNAASVEELEGIPKAKSQKPTAKGTGRSLESLGAA